jgi:hypothetical protein
MLTHLRRLSMSDNLLETPDAFKCLWSCAALEELTLDGNPVCASGAALADLEHLLLPSLPSLKSVHANAAYRFVRAPLLAISAVTNVHGCRSQRQAMEHSSIVYFVDSISQARCVLGGLQISRCTVPLRDG